MIDWSKFKEFLRAQIGKPYRRGAEVKTGETPTELDCSEYVERSYAEIGIKVPDGAHNQYMASRPLRVLEAPRLGDLNFFKKGDASCHHVVIYFDDDNVIEARGEPYNAVILRPRARIEAWKDSTGWRRPHAVDEAEKASA